jgi:hypothetical protein
MTSPRDATSDPAQPPAEKSGGEEPRCWVTERERICLAFLDDKMEATAAMIGKAIYNQISSRHRGGSNLIAIGANVAGNLRKRGLVVRLSDLRAWRITAAGREAIKP